MKTETLERIDTLMTRYVAGLLPEPARVLVDCHLELSNANRTMVAGLETLAGDALELAAPRALSDARHCLEAVLASPAPATLHKQRPRPNGIFPAALASLVDMAPQDIPWRTRMPGFRDYELGEIDGCHVELFWIKPGRTVPRHTHDGMELSLVLDGAFNDITGRYGRGDIAVNDETVDHRPIAEKLVPCIGMAVTDGPLRLTGPLGQRLMDILRA